MHGNEVISRQLLIYLAQYLALHYGRDPRVTNLLNNTEIFLLPSLNPDGYEISQEGACDNDCNFDADFNSCRWSNTADEDQFDWKVSR